MRSTAWRSLGLTTGLFLAAVAASAEPQRWLHIKVHEQTGDRARVSINLPVSMIEHAAPLLEAKRFEGGKLRIDDADIDGADLREIWQAMRAAGDGEYVTVDSDHEKVRIQRKDGFMVIEAHDRRGGGEEVELRIPLAVADALFSGTDGESNELDVAAAMRALAAAGEGELVTVSSDDATVRIWVDARAEAGEAR